MKKERMVIWLTFIFLLTGCQKKNNTENKNKEPIFIAKKAASVTHLPYRAVIEPLAVKTAISPVDGRVQKIFFDYGEKVKKNELLFILDSTELSKEYRESVVSYLQKKAAYQTQIKEEKGNKVLYKAGIVSQEAYMNDEMSFDTSRLSFYQAKFDLEKVMKKSGLNSKKVEKLTIADTKEVNKILQQHFQNIPLYSPASGVALFPPVSTDSTKSDDQDNKVRVGDAVKNGEALLTIGDLSGFSAVLQVSEVDINKLKMGLEATITSAAFPGLALQGVVVSIASQANPKQDMGVSGVSLFNVKVNINKITPDIRRVVRVGMSAKVDIKINNPPQILIPITAINITSTNNRVNIQDPKTGKSHWVNVVVGQTTLNNAVILSGINPGDRVVLND